MAHFAEKVALREFLRASLYILVIRIIVLRDVVQLFTYGQIGRQTVDAQVLWQSRGHVLLLDGIGLGFRRLGGLLTATTVNFPDRDVVIVDIRYLVVHRFNLFYAVITPAFRQVGTTKNDINHLKITY